MREVRNLYSRSAQTKMDRPATKLDSSSRDTAKSKESIPKVPMHQNQRYENQTAQTARTVQTVLKAQTVPTFLRPDGADSADGADGTDVPEGTDEDTQATV